MASLCLPLSAQETGRTIPADLRGLLPNDASAMVLISPMAEIETSIQELLQIAMPDVAPMASLDMVFSQLEAELEMDMSLLDRTKPIGFALGPIDLIGGTEPTVYLMIPSSDPAALLASLPGPVPASATRILGGYLGATKDAYPLEIGISSLPSLLPEGMIAGVFNARPLVEAFGPMAGFMTGMGVAQARTMINADPSTPPALMEMINGILDVTPSTVTEVLDSLTALQMSVDLNGSVLDVTSDLLLQDGSLLSSMAASEGATFGELSHLIDLDAPASFGYGADLGGMARWIRPYVDQILGAIEITDEIEAEADAGPFSSPRKALAVVRAASDSGLAALSNFGSGMVSSMNMVDGKPTSTLWMHGVNGDTLASNLGLFFQTELAGVVGLQMTTTKLGEGTTECSVTLNADTLAANFDMSADEALQIKSGFSEAFGGAIKMSLTSVGTDTLVLYNGTKDDLKGALMAATNAKRGTKQDVRHLNEVLSGASPFEFMRVDLGAMARIALPLIEQFDGPTGMPVGMLDGISIPMTTHSGLTAKKWMGGMSIDLKDVGKLAMMAIVAGPFENAPAEEEPVLRDAE